MVLLNALLLPTQPAQGVTTDHLLVQLRGDAQDEAHQLATQHGFQSARKVRRCLGLCFSSSTTLINAILKIVQSKI